MAWIKFEHTTGTARINMNDTYKIEDSGTLTITFYDSYSLLPVLYTFQNEQAKIEILTKLDKIIPIVNLDSLSPQ
jgi:hypothetical protein